MTRRMKVLSVSSKLTIRLDRTLSRFLRPRLLNSHSPISWRMLTWRSTMQAIPSLSLKRSTGKSSKAWRKCLSNGDQGGLSRPLYDLSDLEHSTRWVHRQWRWKGGSSSWARAANRGRPAKVHQKTPRDCVRFLNCAYMFMYHIW